MVSFAADVNELNILPLDASTNQNVVMNAIDGQPESAIGGKSLVIQLISVTMIQMSSLRFIFQFFAPCKYCKIRLLAKMNRYINLSWSTGEKIIQGFGQG